MGPRPLIHRAVPKGQFSNLPAVKMQKIRRLFSSREGPITKLPIEILMEIFETYAESHPEICNPGPADLCLVNRYWNKAARSTRLLWTKIDIFSPLTKSRLGIVLEQIRLSKPEKIDVAIYFRQPEWDCEKSHEKEDHTDEPTNESIWVQDIMDLLRGTEERWRSIKIVSQNWLPLYKFMEGWTFTHLPSLESISMERENPVFSLQAEWFYPQALIEPMTIFGRNASLPKLRDLSLSAVHVDWDDARESYQNLRKLELKNLTSDTGPSFEQFKAILSSSPNLEYLNVSGFCPEQEGNPAIDVVHLPVLRDFTFGWKDDRNGRKFLEMFQIGRSLETLTLMHAQRDYLATLPVRKRGGWMEDSSGIFKDFHNPGPGGLQNGEGTVPRPFFSMRGVKSLRIICTEATRSSLVPLIKALKELEDILLEDVGRNVLEDVASVLVETSWARRQLRLTLRWTWGTRVPGFAESPIKQLKRAGITVTIGQLG